MDILKNENYYESYYYNLHTYTTYKHLPYKYDENRVLKKKNNNNIKYLIPHNKQKATTTSVRLKKMLFIKQKEKVNFSQIHFYKSFFFFLNNIINILFYFSHFGSKLMIEKLCI